MSVVLGILLRDHKFFVYGAITFFGQPFQTVLLTSYFVTSWNLLAILKVPRHLYTTPRSFNVYKV